MWLLDFCPDFVGMEVRHCKLLECSHFIASLNAVNDRPQLYSFFCCAGGRRVGGADSARLSGSRQAARSAQIAVCYLLGGMGEITHTQMTRR